MTGIDRMSFRYPLSANDLEDAKDALREVLRIFGSGPLSGVYSDVLAKLNAAEDLGGDRRRISLTAGEKQTLDLVLDTPRSQALRSRIFGSVFAVRGGRSRRSRKVRTSRRKTRRRH